MDAIRLDYGIIEGKLPISKTHGPYCSLLGVYIPETKFLVIKSYTMPTFRINARLGFINWDRQISKSDFGQHVCGYVPMDGLSKNTDIYDCKKKSKLQYRFWKNHILRIDCLDSPTFFLEIDVRKLLKMTVMDTNTTINFFI